MSPEPTIALFPFRPGVNPYQTLFRRALEREGAATVPVEPRKLFALRAAADAPADSIHLDWIHDLYLGRSRITRAAKTVMFADGLRRLRRVRAVWTVHNAAAHASLGMSRRAERRRIEAFLGAIDGALFLSESSRQEFIERYRIDSLATAVGHIGSFASAYPNEVGPTDARRALGLAGDHRVALSFGRVLPYKGLEDLIIAFQRVQREGDVLLVAGPAPDSAYRERISRLADEARGAGTIVTHLAEIPVEHVQHYFNCADFCVFPFERILNSASLVLAQSFGCACVAPSAGSLPEYLGASDVPYEPGADLSDVLEQAFVTFSGAHLQRRAQPSAQSDATWRELALAALSLHGAT